jgi:hypothetical protein
VSFTYDVTPTVTIIYPCDCETYDATTWTGMITGTASAGPGASIKSTAVAIEDINTKLWWNGTSFAASTETFVTATGTTTWYLPLPASYLSSGNSYSAVAQATDSAGNIGTSWTVTFSYSNGNTKAPPTVIITYPVNNTTYGTDWGGEITGTASSNAGAGTTIKTTTLAIEDTATNKWWNGTSFSATSQSFTAATGTSTWYLPLATSYLTLGNSYSVVAQATDSAGNIGTSSTVTFTYNTTPPLVTITYPVNGTSYGTNWGGAITGTASGPNLLSSVKVSVQQGSGSASSSWSTGLWIL